MFGSEAAFSISKEFRRDVDTGSQEFIEKNIVPLVSCMKDIISQMKRIHSYYVRNEYTKSLSRLSFFILFAPILISQFSILCMIMGNTHNKKERNDSVNRDESALSAYDCGSLLAAIKLFEVAMVQLKKMESDNSFSNRLLQVPLLSLLVSLTISSGNFSKVQQLLERNLFLSNSFDIDQSKSSFYKYFGPEFYSEILWSQLLQLRLSVPSRRSLQHQDYESKLKDLPENEMADVEQQLISLCVHYGINLWKVFLNGNSNFVSNANYFFLGPDDNAPRTHHNSFDCLHRRKEKNISSQVRKICKTIISTLGNKDAEAEGYGALTDNGRKENRINDVILRRSSNRSQPICSFPYSLLLIGETLRYVQFINCSLSSIPETIGSTCPNIKVLKLSGNKLTRLPDSIGNLSKLIDLDISSNSLNDVNINICSLKRLKILRASNNKIRFIPESLSGCENLVLFDIRHNQILKFPSNLPLKLGKLSSLLIEGNPFSSANMTP